jgi:hypothetical protein
MDSNSNGTSLSLTTTVSSCLVVLVATLVAGMPTASHQAEVYGAMLLAVVVGLLVLSTCVILAFALDRGSKVARSELVMMSVYITNLGTALTNGITFVSESGAHTVSLIRSPRTLALGATLIAAMVWFDGSPSTFASMLQALWTVVLVPIWAMVAAIANVLRLLYAVFVPFVNLYLWIPRMIIKELLADTESCLLVHFKEISIGLAKFSSEYILAVTAWTIGPLWAGSPLDVTTAVGSLQTAVMDAQQAVACECESLNFAMLFISIGLGAKGAYDIYSFSPAPAGDQPDDAPFNIQDYLPVHGMKEAGGAILTGPIDTPAMIISMASTMALPWTLAAVPLVAIHNREAPDFNNSFDQFVAIVVSGSTAFDQTINGAISVVASIVDNGLASINDFKQSQIDWNATYWPPLFTRLAQTAMLPTRVVQQGMHWLMGKSSWLDTDHWRPTIVHTSYVVIAETDRAIIRIIFQDAEIPFLTRLAPAVANTELAVLNYNVWLWNLGVESVIGTTDAVLGRTRFWAVIQHAMTEYEPVRIATVEAGVAWGYAMGYERDSLSNTVRIDATDPFGCVAMESILLGSTVMNSTLTLATEIFTHPNLDDFLETGEALSTASFAQLRTLARCGGLFLAVFASLDTLAGGLSPCPASTNLDSVFVLSTYPRLAWGNTCMKSGMECLLTADPDIVDEFVQYCGPITKDSLIFSPIFPGEPLHPTSPNVCFNLAVRLQTTFVNRCFAIHYNPTNSMCNFAYLVDDITESIVDVVAGFVRLILRLLVQLFGRFSADLPPAWPEDEVATLVCTTRRITGAITVIELGILQEFVAPVVAVMKLAGGNSLAGTDAQIDELIQTTLGDVVLAINMPAAIFVNTTAAIINTAVEAMIDPGTPPQPAGFSQPNKPTESAIVLIAVEIVNGVANYARGVLEAAERFFATGGATFLSLRSAFTESIVFIGVVQRLLAQLFTTVQIIITIIMDFIILLFSGNMTNNELSLLTQDLINAIHGIFTFLTNLVTDLYDTLWHILSGFGGFGEFLATFLTLGCEVVQAISNVWDTFLHKIAGINIVGYHPFHFVLVYLIPQMTSCVPPGGLDKSGTIPPIASICTTDYMCGLVFQPSVTKWCLGGSGVILECNIAPRDEYGCNLQTNTCQFIPLPGVHKTCTGWYAPNECDYAATHNSYCAITNEIGGPSKGLEPCTRCESPVGLTCAMLPGGETISHEGVDDNAFVCTCPRSNTTWSAHPGEFGVECATEAVGDACNPAAASGFGVGVVDLTIAAAVATPVQVQNLRLGTVLNMCILPIDGRCVNTVGTLFPKTCACQTHSSITYNPLWGVNPPAPPTRRLLSSTETYTVEVTDNTIRAALSNGVAMCRVDTDCHQPLISCHTFSGLAKPCALCAKSLLVCDSGRCACSFAPPPTTVIEHGWGVALESRTLYTGVTQSAWTGVSWCDITMRAVVFKGTYSETKQGMTSLEQANFEYCMGLRLGAFFAGGMLNLPVPLGVFYDPFVTIDFTSTLVIEFFTALHREVIGESLESFSRSQMLEGNDPSLGVAVQQHLERLLRTLANVDHSELAKFASESLRRFLASEHTTVRTLASATQSGANVMRHAYNSRKAVTEFVTSVRDHPDATPKFTATMRRLQSVTEDTIQTAKTDITRPFTRSGRHLTSFGTWLYSEVTGCAINVAIADVATQSAKLLAEYFTKRFTVSTNAFTRFNNTHQPGVTAVPTDGTTLKGIFAIDQLEDALNSVANGSLTEEGLTEYLFEFVTCNIDNVMLCRENRGLVHTGKFVLLLMSLITVTIYMIMPEFTRMVILMWTTFGFITVYGAYNISPFCFPMLPTCLADDLMDVFADIKPFSGELELVRLTHKFVENGHTIATCDQPGFNFNSILGNIAYTAAQLNITLGGTEEVPGRPGVHVPGSGSFFAGWFPLYNATATANNDTYRMCNYMTWVRNSGFAIMYTGLAPLAVVAGVTGLLLALSVLYLLAYGIFIAYALYVGPPPDTVNLPPADTKSAAVDSALTIQTQAQIDAAIIQRTQDQFFRPRQMTRRAPFVLPV